MFLVVTIVQPPSCSGILAPSRYATLIPLIQHDLGNCAIPTLERLDASCRCPALQKPLQGTLGWWSRVHEHVQRCHSLRGDTLRELTLCQRRSFYWKGKETLDLAPKNLSIWQSLLQCNLDRNANAALQVTVLMHPFFLGWWWLHWL